jgi:rfaE bifunctional protein nucleotidyltransferase chain/domain
MNKIYPLKNLSSIIKEEKKSKKKIILCHGVFDLLHVGHIKHLEKAKELGDKLVVTITSDRYVNKGPGRPIFNQKLRSESIAALECVDYVAINDNKTAVEPIKIIKPNIYCKGKDYKDSKDDVTGEIKNELNILKKYNGEVIFTEELTFSSSRIINKSTDYYSLRHKKNIKEISKVTNFIKIKKIIDNFKKITILVIGETIIDQYNFCEAIGKSGKEPIMVLRETEKEQYLGGVLGIARHLSELASRIMVISMLGEKKEYFQDIKKTLPKNIKTQFIYTQFLCFIDYYFL